MNKNTECAICDEMIIIASEFDSEICAKCDNDAYNDTCDELRASGINPDESPMMMEIEIMRRILP